MRSGSGMRVIYPEQQKTEKKVYLKIFKYLKELTCPVAKNVNAQKWRHISEKRDFARIAIKRRSKII